MDGKKGPTPWLGRQTIPKGRQAAREGMGAQKKRTLRIVRELTICSFRKGLEV
jgi:hypothetical protein